MINSISNLLLKYSYEGKNRIIVHCCFWVTWFIFIWFNAEFYFHPNDYNLELFFYLAIRDIIWVVFVFFFTTRFISKQLNKGRILFSLLLILLLYFSTHTLTYYSLGLMNRFFPSIAGINYVKYYYKFSFWEGIFARDTFWHNSYWYALYISIPIVLKLFIDISTFRLKNLQLEKANIKLELDYLKSQVNPHFLFNTLNSIYSIVVNSEPKAAQIILKLSDLMRYSLYEANNEQVALSREVQFISDYVELERVRHKKSTVINHSVEGNLSNLEIPPLLLINFVENAFKHGINNNIKASWVNIDIVVEGKNLNFTIENSKPQKMKDEINQGGLGILNVRRRLDMLYPNAYQFDIENTQDSYKVKLFLKLR